MKLFERPEKNMRRPVRRGHATRPYGILFVAAVTLLAVAASESYAQSSWDQRLTQDSRQRIDEVSERQYGEDGTVRRSGQDQSPGYNYPGYFSFYGWYGEIDPTDSPGQNAWGGGFRFAWQGQVRVLVSMDGGTFTDRSFLDAQFARIFPLGVEADLHLAFSDDVGISFVGGLQIGMSMINFDLKSIKYIQIFAGFDAFVGLRIHLGPVFLGADFMIGPQFFIHQWDYDDEEGQTFPPTPPTENRIWVGGNLYLGFTFR